jgi:ABC-type uncharacterized transport system substrate-binding protein
MYSDDKEERERQITEMMAAKVITQIFHYMIWGGYKFSYFTTSEVIVFLQVKKNFQQVYYHIVVPPKKGAQVDIFYFAVLQVTCFCLMTFGFRS